MKLNLVFSLIIPPNKKQTKFGSSEISFEFILSPTLLSKKPTQPRNPSIKF